MVCLTDCGQPASEQDSESLQQENRDQEDGGEMSTKEEVHTFMGFPVTDVAEQLTRLDAVGFIHENPLCCLVGAYWCMFASFLSVFLSHFSGTVRQSGALPLPGLRLVPARQERKPKPGSDGPRHHLPV